eukprot:m51a1_g14173 putative intraflagellar transport protein 52 homolog (456) ;mRNA; r:26028-27781
MNGAKGPGQGATVAGDNAPSILFDASKRESHTPQSGFKKLQRKLRANYRVAMNNQTLTLARLKEHAVVVLGCPRDKYSKEEFEALRSYVEGGGSVLVLVTDGGERAAGTNVNYFLEEYGITVNADSVVRSSYHQYTHPKEVLVTSGIVNREISAAAGKGSETLSFVYPYGSTLNVQKPSVPVLSTSYIAYPINRPVCAFYLAPKKAAPAASNAQGNRKQAAQKDAQKTEAAVQGSIAVLGSVHMFADEWLDKEENEKIQEVVFRWLVPGTRFALNEIDSKVPEISEYHYIPDTEALSERWRSCLQDVDELPSDFTDLFDDSLYKMDTGLVTDSIALYKKLNVEHEPLSLIPPQFEAPLPPLQPAVFPPSLPEMMPPALDMFDLDREFASEKVRLAHQTNGCTEEHIEFYIQACAEIVGVTSQLKEDLKQSPKHILEFMLKKLVNWKRVNVKPDEK